MNFKNFNAFWLSREASDRTMENFDVDQLAAARPRGGEAMWDPAPDLARTDPVDKVIRAAIEWERARSLVPRDVAPNGPPEAIGLPGSRLYILIDMAETRRLGHARAR